MAMHRRFDAELVIILPNYDRHHSRGAPVVVHGCTTTSIPVQVVSWVRPRVIVDTQSAGRP